MIKAALETESGTPLLFLGLSWENVTRLFDGKPILVRAEAMRELGLPDLMVALHYGHTEEAILAELKENGFKLPE